MSESSETANLDLSEFTVPISTVESEPTAPLIIGGAPPPDIAAAAKPRLSPDMLNTIGSSKEVSVPTRLQDFDKLMDPHRTRKGDFFLPGFQGAPFKGHSAPNLKEDDPDHKKPQIGLEPHVYILNMADKQDHEDYEGVMQLVALNYAVISVEERVYDPELKNWRIFLRWALTISYMPRGAI